jgi:hypothetical protein
VLTLLTLKLAEKQTTSSEDEMISITQDELEQSIAAAMADLIDAIDAMKRYSDILQNHLSRTQTSSMQGLQPTGNGTTQILRSPSGSSTF